MSRLACSTEGPSPDCLLGRSNRPAVLSPPRSSHRFVGFLCLSKVCHTVKGLSFIPTTLMASFQISILVSLISLMVSLKMDYINLLKIHQLLLCTIRFFLWPIGLEEEAAAWRKMHTGRSDQNREYLIAQLGHLHPTLTHSLTHSLKSHILR